jgi:hypothetical protein
MVTSFWMRPVDRVFFDASLISLGGVGGSDIFAHAILGLKNRRPALERAFRGKKLYGQCADGFRTKSSAAV